MSLKKILKDAIDLTEERKVLLTEDYARKVLKIHERYELLIMGEHSDGDVKRILKRLKRHKNEMFVFLEDSRVPFHNNESERNIRPMVIASKNSYCNRSEKSAKTYAILASIFRTLACRKKDQIQFVLDYLINDLNYGGFQRINKIAA